MPGQNYPVYPKQELDSSGLTFGGLLLFRFQSRGFTIFVYLGVRVWQG